MSLIKEFIDKSNLTSILVFLFIVVISSFYFYLSTHNQIVGLIADDAIYMLMTDYYSPYYHSLSDSASFVMNTSQFPPLYPLVMAFLGASSEKLVLAHLITTSCLIGATIFYFLWVYKEHKNINTGLCLSLIFLCSPATLVMHIDLWSEHLYLFFTMGALYFINRAKSNSNYLIIAALIIGFLPTIRLVGITFLVAFFLYLHLNNIKHRYRYFFISIFPFLIWKVISINYLLPESYESILGRFYKHETLLVIENLFFVQLSNLWIGWHECFDLQRNTLSGVISAIVLIMAFITWATRLKNKEFDSIYLLFYLLFIWLWPAPDHDMRFIFVTFPILLYYSYLSLLMIFRKYLSSNLESMMNLASIVIVLMSFLPTNLYAINRIFLHDISELESYKFTRYWMTMSSSEKQVENSVNIINKILLSYASVSRVVPENQCVYTVHKEQFMFYSRRLALPLPFPEDVKNKSIVSYLNKCEYIYVHNTNSHPYFPGGYPIDLLQNNFDYLMLMKLHEETDAPIFASLIRLH